MRLYHVTDAASVPAICKDGLVAGGPDGQGCREGVFAWADIADAARYVEFSVFWGARAPVILSFDSDLPCERFSEPLWAMWPLGGGELASGIQLLADRVPLTLRPPEAA